MEAGSGCPSDRRDCDWERNLEASGGTHVSHASPRAVEKRWRMASHAPDKGTGGLHSENMVGGTKERCGAG